MKRKKLTCKEIDAFLMDERKATREYARLGLPALAKDEKRHAKFFMKLKKRCK